MTCGSTSWQQFPLPSSMKKVVSSGFPRESPSSSENSSWKRYPRRCGYWWMCYTLGAPMVQKRIHQQRIHSRQKVRETSLYLKEGHTTRPDLVDLSITKEKIERVLKTLDTLKSPGPDGLHPRLLPEMAEQLAEPFQA